MFEATFEIRVDGLLTELSKEYRAEIQLWCNDHSDFLNIRSPELDALTEQLEAAVSIQDSMREGDQLVVVTDGCLKAFEETLLENHLASNGCLSLPPLSYADGMKQAKVLALDPTSLTDIYDDLRAETSVTVRSKRAIQKLHPEVPIVGLDDVFPSLTTRQFEVFRIAHQGGYYEIPRSITTEDIGTRTGIGRRTAEDHLRRAENKIVNALAAHFSLLH